MSSTPRRGLASPVLVCAVLYGLLLVAWQDWIHPSLPEAPRRGPAGASLPFGYPLPIENGVLYAQRDFLRAELVVAGDSRVLEDVHLDELDAAGLGPSAKVWGAMAQSVDVARLVLPLRPRRLLLALSPTSLHSSPRIVAQQLLVRGPVGVSPDPTPEELAALRSEWTGVARAALVDRSPSEEQVAAFVEEWLRTHGVVGGPDERLVRRTEIELGAWRVTRRIDERLAAWLDALRFDRVGTIRSAGWHRSWFPPNDPTACNAEYEEILTRDSLRTRQKALETLRSLLFELSWKGWEIVCVRLPVSAELFAIEEAAFPNEHFVELCRFLDVPYLDYAQADGYLTRDGSHLTLPSGLRFSRALARDLASVTDWTRPSE